MMRSLNIIEFPGIRGKLHNPGFKGVEFDSFMFQAGSNAFLLETSATIPVFYGRSCCQTWRASARYSSTRACSKATGCCN